MRPEAGPASDAAGWPAFIEPLPDAQAMRDIDRWAGEQGGISSLELMERAGRGLADAVARAAPKGPIAIVCGGGNNGGDGLVAARLLLAASRDVHLMLLSSADELTGDPAVNLRRLLEAGGATIVVPFGTELLRDAAAIVDCVLGTGFSGVPRAAARAAIDAINAAPAAAVIAADVPSGVDASTGEVPVVAVRATATVTFAAAKPGLWIHPGKGHAGQVEVLDIGIPAGAPVKADAGLIGSQVLDVIPRRRPGSTKFTSGYVAVCGGSPGLTGAPSLAAAAAMRAGAGYVTVCLPEALQPSFAARQPEVMTLALPSRRTAAAVLDKATRGALVVGPGMGRGSDAQQLARELAHRAELPLLLDADGLNAHAGHIEKLAARSASTILTPHEGELARLLARDATEIRARRLHHARQAARRGRAVVVLKGDDTIVARPDGLVGINAVSAPGLATAGTGDVLSGVLAAMLAKGLDPFTAACAGVRLHALAGMLAAERVGSAEGVIASDVVACLPQARELR
ncbi:MAG TPA: NAD(P)H-hydrate dehydratase [Solirubrobacteraceae bacterium]|nr:NAD(P)H-hydrate dehydratase [Solirubrobacteraceae bacterium]